MTEIELALRTTADPRLRVLGKCRRRGDCLVWAGTRQVNRHGQGYGMIRTGGRLEMVRRLAYKLWRGDPGDREVRCTCGDSLCCEPSHLVLAGERVTT